MNRPIISMVGAVKNKVYDKTDRVGNALQCRHEQIIKKLGRAQTTLRGAAAVAVKAPVPFSSSSS